MIYVLRKTLSSISCSFERVISTFAYSRCVTHLVSWVLFREQKGNVRRDEARSTSYEDRLSHTFTAPL